jgi:hypothetical protein
MDVQDKSSEQNKSVAKHNNEFPNDDSQFELSSEIVQSLIELQSKEIAVRAQEVEFSREELTIRTKDIDNALIIAEKSIEASQNDRRHIRESQIRLMKIGGVFSLVIIIIMVAFLLLAIHWGKDEIVKQIMTHAEKIFTHGLTLLFGFLIAKYKYSGKLSNTESKED